jgi:acyl-CoA thioester hydrolase
MNPKDIFRHNDEVRDNETDSAGIVNNANYYIYMAHCRHKFVKALGIDFSELRRQGYNLVVAEANIKFKNSLVSGDQYVVTCKVITPNPGRFAFEQEVIRKSDNALAAIGIISATCIVQGTGKVELPEYIKERLGLEW